MSLSGDENEQIANDDYIKKDDFVFAMTHIIDKKRGAEDTEQGKN